MSSMFKPPIVIIIPLIKRDVVIARNDNLELRICVFEGFKYEAVLNEAAGHGDVAGMEDDIAWRDGLAVGTGCLVGAGREGSMVVYLDEGVKTFDLKNGARFTVSSEKIPW